MATEKVTKAVASSDTGADRIVATETEESSEPSWCDQPAFVPLVDLVRRQLPVEQQRLIDDTECFGWLWFDADDGSSCPEAEDCDLRSHCEQVWNMAQVQAGEAVQPEPEPKPEQSLKQTNAKKRAAKRAKKANKKVSRQKWAGTGKYDRTGYQDLSRPVDEWVTAFMKALGEPRVLPKVWNRGNAKEELATQGGLVIAATKSYHAVMYCGVVILRMWTNTPARSIVDLAPELVQSVKAFTATLEWPEGAKPAITDPVPCPANSWMKLRPCTHRTTIKSGKMAEALAKIVLRKFPSV